jgi:hypothetical protein
VGPFSLGHGTFNGNMVDLAIIISTPSSGFDVCV